MAVHNTSNVSILGSGQVCSEPCTHRRRATLRIRSFALAHFLVLGLAACGDTAQPEASARASAKSITVDEVSPAGSSLENDTQPQPPSEIISADSAQVEAAATPLLEVHRSRQSTDTEALRSGAKLRVPPLLLTANLSEVPLRKVTEELVRKLRVKVYIADTVPNEKISAKFDGLPLEEGIQRILQGMNYLLVRTEVPTFIEADDPEDREQLAFGEIHILGKGSGAELDPGGEQALKAAKAEERLAALRRLIEFAAPPEHSAVLIPALRDREPKIRRLALDSLGKAVYPPLDPIASTALQDESPELRMSALRTLVNRYGAIAIPAAEQALTDPNPEVQRTAQASLDLLNKSQRGK